MKKSVRIGVFETNSSSVHSITMCSKADYDMWKKGEVLLDNSWKVDKRFITKEEAIEKMKNSGYCNGVNFNDEDEVRDAMYDNDIRTYNGYFDRDFENFHASYTTKNGEEIVAFGYFGYDG